MDGAGDWRLIEPEQPRSRAADSDETGTKESPRLWIAAIAALVLLSAGIAIWATLPTGGVELDRGGAISAAAPLDRVGAVSSSAAASPVADAAAERPAEIVVDVQGAVTRPGLLSLRDGSRVGDAIAAAGGYSSSVDVTAASRTLNLAAKLGDGDQIRVPILGEEPTFAAPADSGAGAAPPAEGGPIDVNTASAEELDTLPGIGPVTAAKIIDARTEAPFATVDEVLSRGAVGAATFEDIRELITVGQ